MKQVMIYKLGEYYTNDFAIPCKQVESITVARNIILSLHSKWQDEFTDDEYINVFGRPKVVIEKEGKQFIRYKGYWTEPSYEYGEQDYVHCWDVSKKCGRGAIECYIFYCKDNYAEYDQYGRMKEENKMKTITISEKSIKTIVAVLKEEIKSCNDSEVTEEYTKIINELEGENN